LCILLRAALSVNGFKEALTFLDGAHRTAAEFLANLYQHKRALYQAWEVLRHCFPLAALWHLLEIQAVMQVTAAVQIPR